MQKIILKKFLKEIKGIAIIAAVFLAVLRQAQNKVWAVMPANGAEAAKLIF